VECLTKDDFFVLYDSSAVQRFYLKTTDLIESTLKGERKKHVDSNVDEKASSFARKIERVVGS